MLKEIYSCDRKGCKNITRQTGQEKDFFNCYEDENWIAGKVKDRRYDWCSYECVSIWAEDEAKKIREGNK
jgi:hypothetical protein